MSESRLLIKTDPHSLSNALESLYLTTQEALRSWQAVGACDRGEATVILNQLKQVAEMMSLPRTLKFLAVMPEVNPAVGINWAMMIINLIESTPEIYRYCKQGTLYRLYAVNLTGNLRREAQSESEFIIRGMAEASINSTGDEIMVSNGDVTAHGYTQNTYEGAEIIDFPVSVDQDAAQGFIQFICDVRDNEPELITDENRFLPLELKDCMSGKRIAFHNAPKDGWTQETLETHYSKTATDQPVDAFIGGQFVGSTEV